MRRRDFVSLTAMTIGAAVLPSRLWGQGAKEGAADPEAAAFTAARRFADLRCGRVAYVEQGKGPAALFLHGFPLSGFQWRGALPRLAPHRRCLAPDFLGLGATEVAEGQGVGPDDQVAMLVELLDRLKVETVDLVASDSGGAVAQLFLVRHPRRVRTLLLANCDAEPDSPPPALLPVIELARKGEFADQWLAPWVADGKLARSPEGLGGMCYKNPEHPTDAAIAAYLAPLVSSPRRKALVHAYALALERNPLAGIAPALQKSQAPVRIVWGTADTIFSAQSPDYLAGIFGASRGVRKLPGYKLFWPEELPEVVAEEALLLWKS